MKMWISLRKFRKIYLPKGILSVNISTTKIRVVMNKTPPSKYNRCLSAAEYSVVIFLGTALTCSCFNLDRCFY